MWNTDYHLRRTKFIVYQLAMILCIISESVGTAALDDYIRQQRFIERLDRRAAVHNNGYVGVASFNIFVGVYVAFVFGSAFFFDLFFPERRESRAVRRAWKTCAVLAVLFALGDAIAMTVVVFTHSGRITGVPASTAFRLLYQHSDKPPLLYRRNTRALISVAFIWPGWLAVIASTVVLFVSHRHDDRLGPWSKAKHSSKERIASPVS